MIIQPKIVRNVCLTAHPKGCAQGVKEQIEWVSGRPASGITPQRVLVIGGSTGYGLASRITAAFWGHADTVGISFEREPSEKKTGTPGWYNNRAFDAAAEQRGLKAVTIEGDAFSHEVKQRTIDVLKHDIGKVDAVIYSLASPMRTDPDTGETYMSVIKPIGMPYTGYSVDMMTEKISLTTIDPATKQQIASTVKVMGGEDWMLWMQALLEAGVLSPGAVTAAYSYIGPEITFPLYREGTIGRAKEDLEQKARKIHTMLSEIGGSAYVSVNKALVTRASAVIPVVPLYISILYKVMKKKGLHEGCIEQIYRLFCERLFTGNDVPVDEQGRIRIDDYEMRDDVQAETADLWKSIENQDLHAISDIKGYRSEYFQLHGFEFPGVNYDEDTDPMSIN